MNNRQANGRRRGRGGQQRQGGNPSQGNGNRIDNRARGNAAQLLEKYKNLARDAQMQGDRVNTEYYLQFADHYFRVLSETRSRFEEQNPQARRQRDEEEGEDFDLEAEGNRAEEPRYEREPRDTRYDRDDRQDERQEAPRDDRREARDTRAPREGGRNGRANGHSANGYHGSEGESFEPAEQQGERRPRRPRREAAPQQERDVEPAGIDAAVLPPALGGDVADANEDKPRRRGRPRRNADEAPAA